MWGPHRRAGQVQGTQRHLDVVNEISSPFFLDISPGRPAPVYRQLSLDTGLCFSFSREHGPKDSACPAVLGHDDPY